QPRSTRGCDARSLGSARKLRSRAAWETRDAERAGRLPAMNDDPFFSVIVPTRGDSAKLGPLLDALARQSFSRDRFEILIAFDGAAPDPAMGGAAGNGGARGFMSPGRRGPGAAGNLAGAKARGTYLAFTEDDCLPSQDWLAQAATRLEREPVDVLEGDT